MITQDAVDAYLSNGTIYPIRNLGEFKAIECCTALMRLRCWLHTMDASNEAIAQVGRWLWNPYMVRSIAS